MVELYCIYDKVSATYGQPIAFANRAVAVRFLKNQFNDNNAYLKQDSDIYYIGTYDQFTGHIECNKDGLEFVCNIGALDNE